MLTVDAYKCIFNFLTRDDLVLMKLVSKTFKRVIEKLKIGSKCNLVTLYNYGNPKLLDYLHTHFKITPDIIAICRQPKNVGEWWCRHFEKVGFYVAVRWHDFDKALKLRKSVCAPMNFAFGCCVQVFIDDERHSYKFDGEITPKVSPYACDLRAMTDKQTPPYEFEGDFTPEISPYACGLRGMTDNENPLYEFGGDAATLIQVGVMGDVESLKWIYKYSLPGQWDIFNMSTAFIKTLHLEPVAILEYLVEKFPHSFKYSYRDHKIWKSYLLNDAQDLAYNCLKTGKNEHFIILAQLTRPLLPISQRDISALGSSILKKELDASGFDIDCEYVETKCL